MTGKGQDWSNFSMLELFRMEVESQVAILVENLLALERCAQSGSCDRPEVARMLESLMRAAHSIKGAARIVQIDTAVEIAHRLEDCFVAAQKGLLHLDADRVDVLLKGVDLLAQIGRLEEDELNDWVADRQKVIEGQTRAIAAIVAEPLEPELDSGAQHESESVAESIEVSDSSNLPDIEEQSLEEVTTTDPGSNLGTESEPNLEPESTPVANVTQPQPELQPEPIAATNPGATDAIESITTNPTPIATGAKPAAQDRVVRISIDNLNQLMALAGESLVEVNWLQPFADSLSQLKRRQQELSRLLENFQSFLPDAQVNATAGRYLAEAQQKSHDCHELLSDRLNDLELFSRRFTNLSDNLYREVIASHMRPFGDGVKGFPRMVRDLAKQLGKQVNLEITGQSTQVDRDILDRLEAPITHMLRNAIAHGIETPAERIAAGKPEFGTIHLAATHRAGMLAIAIVDDGCGIDLEQLRHSVVAKNLATADVAIQLSEAELLEFLFLPGFSTADRVTELAGRGFGLDIAKSMAQEVGGFLRAATKLGQGTTFQFQLPLTLSVIRALLVEISGEVYAFGLTRIDRVLSVNRPDIFIAENRQYIVVDEQNIGLVSARQVLELPEPNLEESLLLPVVVLGDQSHRYGLVVDRFLGERDLVVRPLDSRLGKVKNISAASVMEDGSPLLIIDTADLVRSIDTLISGGNLNLIGDDGTAEVERASKRVLVVDDSITVREMERKLLQNNGYEVDVAVNGMEGWNAVRMGNYDLVISDIDMPRMNGIELVTQIKSHPQLKSIPTIIVSYKDREEDKIAGLQAGADYYLTKSSFHDDSLINAVVDLIGKA
jgi:two-component system sensor histidine kinase and response regulator WspE